MTHEDLVYKSNIEKLAQNGLILYREMDNDPFIDIKISNITGHAFVTGYIDKHSVADWLATNINEAICLSKYSVKELETGDSWFISGHGKKRIPSAPPRKSIEELVFMYDNLLDELLTVREAKNAIDKKTFRQWILGTLSDYVSEPIADKLSIEIINFGEEHNLLRE